MNNAKQAGANCISGGKSGSWGKRHRGLVFLTKDDENLIAVVLTNSKQGFEIMYENVEALLTESKVAYGTTIKTAQFSAICGGNKEHLCENDHSAFKKYVPASITKLLTAYCTIRLVTDLNDRLLIRDEDIDGSGTGHMYEVGFEVTISDALIAMLMESSNTMANAIARTVGEKYL